MNGEMLRKPQTPVLFHPIEQAFLMAYFGVEPVPGIQDIDIWQDLGQDSDLDEVVRLHTDLWGDTGDLTISNAVARLVLGNIQERLPQWGKSYEDGTVLLGREYEQLRHRKVSVLPKLVCGINWADSGPGFSWPEDYYVTFVPIFDRYVVTASQDSPDAYGYVDIAIGHFGLDEDVNAGCKRIIISWWSEQTGGDPDRAWQALWKFGLTGQVEAEEWAAEVWPELYGSEEVDEYGESL